MTCIYVFADVSTGSPIVRISGLAAGHVQANTSGEYIRLPARQNDGKPVYKQQGGSNHMWWESSQSVWYVGSEASIGKSQGLLYVEDSAAYPELITGTWQAAVGGKWSASYGDGKWAECSATVRETGACMCVP